MAYTIHYASGANQEDVGAPPQLFAGDTPPVVTQDFLLDLAAPIAQFAPLTRDGAGFKLWAAGSPVDAVAAYGISAGSTRAAVYTAGMFNIDALAWPPGTTETAALTAATSGVKYRKLLNSKERTGDEPKTVGAGSEAGQAPLILTMPSGTVFPSSAVGSDVTLRIGAEGGASPYQFRVASGNLPAGLVLNPSTGLVSGKPTAAGAYQFTIVVGDSKGATAQADYSITITA